MVRKREKTRYVVECALHTVDVKVYQSAGRRPWKPK
jgi:ribosomal protein S26